MITSMPMGKMQRGCGVIAFLVVLFFCLTATAVFQGKVFAAFVFGTATLWFDFVLVVGVNLILDRRAFDQCIADLEAMGRQMPAGVDPAIAHGLGQLIGMSKQFIKEIDREPQR